MNVIMFYRDVDFTFRVILEDVLLPHSAAALYCTVLQQVLVEVTLKVGIKKSFKTNTH